MTAQELVQLIEAGDRYGLVIAATQWWMQKHHPEADRAALHAYAGDDLLSTRIRIPALADAAGCASERR